MTDHPDIPVPADRLLRMMDLLTAIIREGNHHGRVEMVELAERCKLLVEEALRLETN
jgi:hypothetical protein